MPTRVLNQFGKPYVSTSDGYEGGKRNRRVAGFTPNIDRTADLEILGDYDLLTARGRWLGRNNPWCRGAKWTITDNYLGRGIRTRQTARDRSKKLMTEFNGAADDLYDRYVDEADIAGRMNLFQMTRTGLMSTVEAAEVLYVQRQDSEGFRRGERLIPLAWELVEPDQFDTTKDRDPGAGENEIRRGIEFDANGRRVAYHLYTQHPGALYPTRIFESERVPADRVIHLYRAERPTQSRGVTWYAPIITSLWNLYEYQSAEIDAHKVASYFVYLWKRSDPGSTGSFGIQGDDDDDLTDMFGNDIEDLVPGIGLTGGPEDDLKVIQSNRGSSDSVPWLQLMLQTMGVGLHLGYSKLTGDFTKGNWAQLRAEDQNDQRGFDPGRDWHASYVDLEIRKRAVRQMIAFDVLPIPQGGVARFNRNPKRFLSCKALPPRQNYLNPREEVAASLEALRGGLSNFDIELSARGLDVNEVHMQAADELGVSIEEYREILRSNMAVPGTAGTEGNQSGVEGANDNQGPE